MPNISDWLSHWSNVSQGGVMDPFDCYTPVDLQTRILSCSSPRFCPGNDRAVFQRSNGSLNADFAFEKAKSRIAERSKIKFVGLAELYQESLCVIHVHTHKIFPPYCDCEDQNWTDFPKTEANLAATVQNFTLA